MFTLEIGYSSFVEYQKKQPQIVLCMDFPQLEFVSLKKRQQLVLTPTKISLSGLSSGVSIQPCVYLSVLHSLPPFKTLLILISLVQFLHAAFLSFEKVLDLLEEQVLLMNFGEKKHLHSQYCSSAPAISGCCICSLEQGCKQQQMPVGGNQITEYCKCCTVRGGASQTGWRGIIPILKGCYQTFHSPAFLTVLLIKQVHLLFSVLVSFSFSLLHVPRSPIFIAQDCISCQLVMVNLHPCVGTIVWKHRSLSALHFAECGPSCLGTQSRK